MDPGESRVVRALFTDDTSKQVEETVSATEPGELFTLSMDLPVSVIVGRVLESDGVTPVANAFPEVDRQIGNSFEFIFGTADAGGHFTFFNQEPGIFELFAEDDFALSRFERVELPSDTLTLVKDLVLPPFGTVEGTVTDHTGSPVAFPEVALPKRERVLHALREREMRAAISRFDHVAAGSYSVTHTQSLSRLSATITGRVDEGELEVAELVLPGVGTVSGQFLDSGGLAATPVDPTTAASVEFRGQESEDFPRIFEKSETLETDGAYLVDGAPVGKVTITIDDAGDVGTATATVVEGAETTADVTLGTATGVPITLALDPVIGADGFTQIDVDGVLLGTAGFELGRVWLNDKLTPDLSSAQTEPSGQHVFGPMRAAGVDHTRKIQISADKRRVRYLEILENPHAFDIEVTFFLYADGLFVSETSSGDAVVDFTDRYVAMFDDDVEVATVYAGSGAVRLPDSLRSSLDLALEWRRVTIPAGGKVMVLHFALQDESPGKLRG